MKTTNIYTWKTPRGARIEATITVDHITSKTLYNDGNPVEAKCNHWLYSVDALTANGKATALRELSSWGATPVIVIARRGKDKTMVAIPDDIADAIYGEERRWRAKSLDREIEAEKAHDAAMRNIYKAMNP